MWLYFDSLAHMNNHYEDNADFTWLWMGFTLILFTAAIIGGIWLLTRTSNGRDDHMRIDPAEEALRLRFARGELSEEEFNNRLDSLMRSRR